MPSTPSPEEEDDSLPPTLPLPLTASLHLSSLPPSASHALSLANESQNPTSPSPVPPSSSFPSSNPNPNPATSLLSSSSSKNAIKANDNKPDPNALPDKVTIRFQAVGSAPQLSQKIFKISSGNRFESVVAFLGRKLRGAGVGGGKSGGEGKGVGEGGGGGVFCYVNSVFAPGLDEGVGGLWRCFKTDDQLIVAYSMTPAFG